MPSTKTEYKILLSSPSDLYEERSAASKVVAELSATLGETQNIVLRMLAWETTSAPGFSSEPQAVINKSLGENWDIYLGIMHARFGTPTAHFGSGTEEEFDRAFTLWQKEPERRELMVYFKSAPVDINTVDIIQLGKVREFKKKVGSLGGLYREFSDAAGFEDLLRVHLTQVLMKLHQNSNLPNGERTHAVAASVEIVTSGGDEEIPGLLDLMEAGLKGMSDLSQAISGIGEVMQTATVDVGARMADFRAASSAGDLAWMRRSISSLSKSMLDLAKAIADRRRQYASASRVAFESLSKAISLARAMSSDGLKDMSSFISGISSSIGMLDSFAAVVRDTERIISDLPNIAKEFSNARMLLRQELNTFGGELSASLVLLQQLKSTAEG